MNRVVHALAAACALAANANTKAVIPATTRVIPAKAGIQRLGFPPSRE